MSLRITKIENGKTPETDWITLRADDAINLSEYALADRTFAADGTPSNEFRHIFLFPNKKVAKGEWVRLHLRKGARSLGKERTTMGQ